MTFRAILRAPMRRSAALAPLVLLLACSSPCQDLATRICDCEPAGTARTNCQRSIEDQIGSGNPRPGQSQQDFCDAKLKTCADPGSDREACDRLHTPEGKIACGLAYPDDQGTGSPSP